MRLTARGRRVLWTAAFAATFAAGMAVQTDAAQCRYEDEVRLHTGQCHPLDDSTFGTEGWEAK